MDTKAIRKLMIDRDFTMKALARRVGYTREWTSKVIRGRVKSPEAERRILSALTDPSISPDPQQHRARA